MNGDVRDNEEKSTVAARRTLGVSQGSSQRSGQSWRWGANPSRATKGPIGRSEFERLVDWSQIGRFKGSASRRRAEKLRRAALSDVGKPTQGVAQGWPSCADHCQRARISTPSQHKGWDTSSNI
ncbi:hypothetical protein PAXINDRAFT_19292 [Paxillus involutus ATCC 200175]|uniref:Uncharacterized protein n=1 Tax=Paxillus involutus ATCC 200175 TaxID=664439 RepID=A0A0C9SN93_PAXIN|nr:hypothetical protein PAXINDRAFT_19292 [Paxillus involutus ATCC 200175]